MIDRPHLLPLLAPPTQELKEEMDEKETVMSALTATGQNIIDELESKGAPQGEIGEQLPQIKARWEALGDAFQLQLQKQEEAASRFDSFLTSFTSLLNWMSEFHSTLVDELCVQIPHKASEDTVARHKARLEVRPLTMLPDNWLNTNVLQIIDVATMYMHVHVIVNTNLC